MSKYNRERYILSESPLKRHLLKLFKKNDKIIIFDIGGCEGEDSIRYSIIFPSSQIFVFEPLPNNQKLIVENIDKYKASNIKLIPSAVSDLDGFLEFHVSSGDPEHESDKLDWDFGNKSSSLLPPDKLNNPSWLQFSEKIEVETITLNSFLLTNKIEEVDFVHMDIQGAELKVLIGAKDFINKVKTVWLEVADIELYKGQPLRVDIENFMIKNGFYLVISKMEGQFGDQFYLNKKYFETFSFFNKKIQIHKKMNSQFLTMDTLWNKSR